MDVRARMFTGLRFVQDLNEGDKWADWTPPSEVDRGGSSNDGQPAGASPIRDRATLSIKTKEPDDHHRALGEEEEEEENPQFLTYRAREKERMDVRARKFTGLRFVQDLNAGNEWADSTTSSEVDRGGSSNNGQPAGASPIRDRATLSIKTKEPDDHHRALGEEEEEEENPQFLTYRAREKERMDVRPRMFTGLRFVQDLNAGDKWADWTPPSKVDRGGSSNDGQPAGASPIRDRATLSIKTKEPDDHHRALGEEEEENPQFLTYRAREKESMDVRPRMFTGLRFVQDLNAGDKWADWTPPSKVDRGGSSNDGQPAGASPIRDRATLSIKTKEPDDHHRALGEEEEENPQFLTYRAREKESMDVRPRMFTGLRFVQDLNAGDKWADWTPPSKVDRGGSSNDGQPAGASPIRDRATLSIKTKEPDDHHRALGEEEEEEENPQFLTYRAREKERMDVRPRMFTGLRFVQDLNAGDKWADWTPSSEVDRGGSSNDGQPADASPIRDRATLSIKTKEPDDHHRALGEEEEEDGDASFGSGEIFDDALERIAATSGANGGIGDPSYDTATNPQFLSPVGLLTGPAVLGSPPSVMSMSQQGALMRLNEMLTGEMLLDTSIIDNSSPEEFEHCVTELAQSQGRSVDDASFVSILDALLPWVLEKSQEKHSDANSAEPKDASREVRTASVDNAEELGGKQNTIPEAQLAAEDVPDDDGNEGSKEDPLENKDGRDHAGNFDAEDGDGKEVSGVKVQQDTRVGPKVSSNSVEDEGSTEDLEEAKENNDGREARESSMIRQDEEIGESSGSRNPQEAAEGTRAGQVPEAEAEDVAVVLNVDDRQERTGAENLNVDGRKEEKGAENLNVDDGKEEKGAENLIVEDRKEEKGSENSRAEAKDDGGDGDDKVMEEPSALAAFVRAAHPGASGEADSPSLGAAGPSLPARPTRPGRSSLPSLEPAARAVQQPRSREAAPARFSNLTDEAPDGNEPTLENLQMIKVKLLRLALRLGQPAHSVVVSQVLYRLGLAEQLRGVRSDSRSAAFSLDRAIAMAGEEEAAGPEGLEFSCTIMLLGKSGVGKSATINSIFDEQVSETNAFRPSTKKVHVITGLVHGIKVRVIDTPGLLPSLADQRHNEKVMASVKGFIKKQPPDIVLYVDRLDMQSHDYGDLPLLRTITDSFGAALWFNSVVVLTHASSAPPDASNGLPVSYEVFVSQRSRGVQQAIQRAAEGVSLMNPVSLVENHHACRSNRSGQRLLPNGQVWKPHLLLLCFAAKILAEANSLLKLQSNTPGGRFGAQSRVPPLPFLLSSLLQSRAQLKLPDEQMDGEDESDEDLEEDVDEDFDQLPPFRRVANEELAHLDGDTRGKYFEELSERERLFGQKQRKELKRRKELKGRMTEAPSDGEGLQDDMESSAAVPVPMPDMALPPSFDSDNPSHRYRYVETANQWIVRPVLETHGWDHDNGYDGMSVERLFVLGDSVPTSVRGTITKDKKETSMNIECGASMNLGQGKVTQAGLDILSIVKDVAYTVRSETSFCNFKGNKTTGGLALTVLGDTIRTGMKIEDRLMVTKLVKLVLNGGVVTGGDDVAYGGSLEVSLRDKHHPFGRTLSTVVVSVMDWHGDLAIGGNWQTQFLLGRTMMVGRANLSNRGAGQISIRASSSEQIHMALIGLLPIIRSLVNHLLGSQADE